MKIPGAAKTFKMKDELDQLLKEIHFSSQWSNGALFFLSHLFFPFEIALSQLSSWIAYIFEIPSNNFCIVILSNFSSLIPPSWVKFSIEKLIIDVLNIICTRIIWSFKN